VTDLDRSTSIIARHARGERPTATCTECGAPCFSAEATGPCWACTPRQCDGCLEWFRNEQLVGGECHACRVGQYDDRHCEEVHDDE
jgi:hypothetical protein